MAKIALSLSGGGFRAATYHLGVLSYLSSLKTSDGKTLLDHVNTISTISGGTLTGLWLMMCKCQGKDDVDMLRGLYNILMDDKLISRASLEFLNGKNKNVSLIREMVRIYDEEIFHGATLALLYNNIDTISIDDFSANATEFKNAVEFRFQVGKKQKTSKGGTSQGFVGNTYYKIPCNIASQIRLAEIFAASSCFPGGFEALFFPRDFKLAENSANAEYLAKTEDIALMDGGVVDNQGVEPVTLIRKRRDLDLFIISDAGCGNDVSYSYQETKTCSHLTIHKLNITLNILLLAIAQFLLWVPQGFWFGFFTGLTIVSAVLRIATAVTSRLLAKKYAKLVPFSFKWKELLKIPFSKYINLFMSRATSMLTLTDKVFMKHIRSLNYATIYEDSQWQNRRIMNGLYELGAEKNWGKHLTDEEDAVMEPSEAVHETTDIARDMATTLWWSESDRKMRKPECLLACGQYTICWNLLEYIYRLRRNNDNINENHQVILELQSKLEDDWNRFKEDPFFMLDIFR